MPIIDKPPSTPKIGLSVFFASSTPAGIEISTSSPPILNSAATFFINLRGAGFIAGSPIGSCIPAFVILPTPKPALKIISSPEIFRVVVKTDAPFVISGSSPENFITSAQIALSEIFSRFLIGIFKGVPSSAIISTVSTTSPVVK